MKTLSALALGYAGAIVSAAIMLLMGVLANLGIYVKAAEHMQDWHMFFSLSIGGIIGGMIEAAVMSFIILYAFALVYNTLVTKKGE